MTDTSTKDQAEASVGVADAQIISKEDTSVATETDKMNATSDAAAGEAFAEVKSKENPEENPEKIPEKKSEAATETSGNTQEVQNGSEKPSSRNGHAVIKKNSKFDASTLPVTDDPAAIRTQVEYYFGDSNLPTDKFMWESTGGSENKPVPLKTICSFKRMHRFQPYSAVVAALKDSKTLEVIGEDGNEMVKRTKAYRSLPNAQKQRLAQSVYIKGFGAEEQTTQVDIEAWLSNFGGIDRVKLRRTYPENEFKGSVFVEFQTEELAKQFVSLSPAPTWKGNELKIMRKSDYLDEKTRQIQAGEIEPSKGRATFFEGKEKGGHGRGGRGRANLNGRADNDNWKKRRDEDQKNGFRGGRGGRGGRGRGRGGRGGRGRGGRDNQDKREAAPRSTNNVKMPTIQATDERGEAVTKGTEANGKRTREDDGGEAPPAKKVDTKAEALAT